MDMCTAGLQTTTGCGGRTGGPLPLRGKAGEDLEDSLEEDSGEDGEVEEASIMPSASTVWTLTGTSPSTSTDRELLMTPVRILTAGLLHSLRPSLWLL